MLQHVDGDDGTVARLGDGPVRVETVLPLDKSVGGKHLYEVLRAPSCDPELGKRKLLRRWRSPAGGPRWQRGTKLTKDKTMSARPPISDPTTHARPRNGTVLVPRGAF